MFNQKIDSWKFSRGEYPEDGVPVFILIEHDVVHDVDREAPFVRKASLHTYDREPKIKYWKLEDFDPEEEEEILQQCFSVVAWRHADQ